MDLKNASALAQGRPFWNPHMELMSREELPPRLRERVRGQAAARELLRVLQHALPAFVPGRTNAGYGILRKQ